jgi:hypothetical protein
VGPLQIVLPGLGCGTNLAARSRNSVGTEPGLHGEGGHNNQKMVTTITTGPGVVQKMNDMFGKMVGQKLIFKFSGQRS